MTSLFVSACAHTSIYSDAALTQKSGFRYYTARPYLLVSHTTGEESKVEVSVVYLPDLEHPQFAVPHAGWGSSEFNVSVANGSVASIGGKVDATGAETITALGTLLASAAGLNKSTLRGNVRAGTDAFDLYEIRQENGTTRLVPVTR